ncbi:MAG: SAM-dependent methyltransferase [Phycisphaerae bacterium]
MDDQPPQPQAYVSRGGDKLAAALDHFALDVAGHVCADLGSHVGGFLDCLLRRGAARVYSVDTAYGILAWHLRTDPRVVVYERTNAMHVTLPERPDMITIDLGWTRQAKVLPNVATIAARDAHVVTLIKPHYEADRNALRLGVLPDDAVDDVVAGVLADLHTMGWRSIDRCSSPFRGRGGNREVFALLVRA